MLSKTNFFTLFSLAALIAFAKIQISNRGFQRKFERDQSMKLENSNNLYKFNNNPFRFIGNTNSGFSNAQRKRNPFKNFR